MYLSTKLFILSSLVSAMRRINSSQSHTYIVQQEVLLLALPISWRNEDEWKICAPLFQTDFCITHSGLMVLFHLSIMSPVASLSFMANHVIKENFGVECVTTHLWSKRKRVESHELESMFVWKRTFVCAYLHNLSIEFVLILSNTMFLITFSTVACSLITRSMYPLWYPANPPERCIDTTLYFYFIKPFG